MRKTPRHFALLATLAVGLVLEGCSDRHLASLGPGTREPVTALPASFRAGGGEAAPAGSASSARVEWREFFSDPRLVELIETAIGNNKEVNVMAQRIRVARNEIQARRGEYQPFVDLVAEAGGERVGEHTRDGAVEEALTLPEGKPFPTFLQDLRFGLSASWEIDAWKKLRNANKVAVLEYLASEEGRHLLVTGLIAEVARSYYELAALDNQLGNLSQNIALQRDGLEMARQLKAFARSNALAVNRYEAEVAKNMARRYAIEQEITVVENRLNTLLGRTPRPIARDSAGFMDFVPGTLVSGVPSELLRNRPDLRRAELELQAAKLNIRIARADFFPRMELRAGLGFRAASLRHLFKTPESLAASLLGGLVAPLANRKAIVARYRSANAMQVAAAFEYEQAVLNAFTEVANQLSRIDNLAGSLRYKQEQVDLLQQAIEVATQLFRSARAEYLEVLLTQREALEARSELIETKEQQIMAMVDLYRALGGGWQDPRSDVVGADGLAGQQAGSPGPHDLGGPDLARPEQVGP